MGGWAHAILAASSTLPALLEQVVEAGAARGLRWRFGAHDAVELQLNGAGRRGVEAEFVEVRAIEVCTDGGHGDVRRPRSGIARGRPERVHFSRAADKEAAHVLDAALHWPPRVHLHIERALRVLQVLAPRAVTSAPRVSMGKDARVARQRGEAGGELPVL